MKTLKLLAIMFTLLVFIYGCSKDDSSGPAGSGPNNNDEIDFIEFKLDGTFIRVNMAQPSAGTGVYSIFSDSIYNISMGWATLTDAKKSALSLFDTASFHTNIYNLLAGSDNISFVYWPEQNEYYSISNASAGFVEITKVSDTAGSIIEGTFSFSDIKLCHKDSLKSNYIISSGHEITQGRFRSTLN